MFNNIGEKIKSIARLFTWLGIGISIVVAVALFTTEEDLLIALGLGVMIIGSLLSWVSSFLLYGFGQLIQNSDILAGRITLEEVIADEKQKTQELANQTQEGMREEEIEIKDPELIKRSEMLKMRYIKGEISEETFKREYDLILKQAKWYSE